MKIIVRVNVDKAWRENEARGIEGFFCFCLDIRADLDDAIAVNANITVNFAGTGGPPCAIDNGRTLDYEVEQRVFFFPRIRDFASSQKRSQGL